MDLSVLILSYNTCDITKNCLSALVACLQSPLNSSLSAEIIIVDNASSDGSHQMLDDFSRTSSIPVTYIPNKENVGFARGNNLALQYAKGRYILYLNSDVILNTIPFLELIQQFKDRDSLGALTVGVVLTDGTRDEASHRGFPTPWNAFCYYSQLEHISLHIPFLRRIFGGYHQTWKDTNGAHTIDVASGAFLLVKKQILDRLKGFDEAFFMYGEDIDLAYRLSLLGYSILFYPAYTVTHLKYSSGIKNSNVKTKKKMSKHFYEAMKIFYDKHYRAKYPVIITKLIHSVIAFKMRRI